MKVGQIYNRKPNAEYGWDEQIEITKVIDNETHNHRSVRNGIEYTYKNITILNAYDLDKSCIVQEDLKDLLK